MLGESLRFLKLRQIGALLFGVSLVAANPAFATTLTYEYLTTATDGGPGSGITYTLTIDTATGASTFTIDGHIEATEVWRAGWFTFKFEGGSTPNDLTSLSAPAGTGPWSIADVNENTNVKVLAGGNYNQLLEASSTGFYVTSLAQPAPDDPTQGICLTYALCDPDLPLTFTFTITDLPASWDPDTIPFQVGYYDGQTKKFKWVTNQLSEVLDESTVPDAGATIGLLGLGLLGLAYFRRQSQN